MAGMRRGLVKQVESYLEMQLATGHRLQREGLLLRAFARFSAQNGMDYVCAEFAIRFACASNSTWLRVHCLHTIHRFVRYARAEDNRHEFPPPDYFGRYPNRRPTPYILSPTEIARIMTASSRWPAGKSQRNLVYTTLFGLLASTGTRISEALGLRLGDLQHGVLAIRNSKGRSRAIPLHPSVEAALARYLQGRCGLLAASEFVFPSTNGTKMLGSVASAVFRQLVDSTGIPRRQGVRGPVLHSLRHTFAVRALQSCATDRKMVAIHTRAVSLYLGHSDIAHTYWYYEATPQLLRSIAYSSERHIRRAQ